MEKTLQEVKILKDKDELKKVFLKSANSKTQVWLFNSTWNLEETFPEDYSNWLEKLKENKQTALIVKDSKFIESDKELSQTYKIRYIPSQFAFPSTTIIFEDQVLMIIGAIQPIGILIQGKEISESHRQYFTLLWESSKTKQEIEKQLKKKGFWLIIKNYHQL